MSAPREHAAVLTGHLRQHPGAAGFIVMFLVAATGAVAPLVRDLGGFIVVPYAAVMTTLAIGVLRSYRHSWLALVGLAMAIAGLSVVAFGEVVPKFQTYYDSAHMAVAAETAFAGLALLAFGAGRVATRWRLLAVAGVSLLLGVGVVLYPILESLQISRINEVFRAGMFAAFTLLAFALFCATPRSRTA